MLAYDEDCAGGLMNVDIVTVRPDVTLEVVSRYLRARGEMADGTDSIFVVDRNDKYVGSLFLSRLVTSDPATRVDAVMSTEILAIPAPRLRRHRSSGNSSIVTCFRLPSSTKTTAYWAELPSTMSLTKYATKQNTR